MKKLLLLVAFATFFMYSCSDDDDENDDVNLNSFLIPLESGKKWTYEVELDGVKSTEIWKMNAGKSNIFIIDINGDGKKREHTFYMEMIYQSVNNKNHSNCYRSDALSGGISYFYNAETQEIECNTTGAKREYPKDIEALPLTTKDGWFWYKKEMIELNNVEYMAYYCQSHNEQQAEVYVKGIGLVAYAYIGDGQYYKKILVKLVDWE